MLCPEHPKAAEMKATAVAGLELFNKTQSDQAGTKKAIGDGGQVGAGNYLIGIDVQPGLGQTVGEKVVDCNWEISDAQADIMAHNFVSTAPQFANIEVPAVTGGFTVQGCAFRQVSP